MRRRIRSSIEVYNRNEGGVSLPRLLVAVGVERLPKHQEEEEEEVVLLPRWRRFVVLPR